MVVASKQKDHEMSVENENPKSNANGQSDATRLVDLLFLDAKICAPCAAMTKALEVMRKIRKTYIADAKY